MPRQSRARAHTTGAVVLTLLLAACGGTTQPKAGSTATTRATAGGPATTVPAAPTSTAPPYPVYTVATAHVATVEVYDEPAQTAPIRTFASPDPYYDTVKVFLVREEKGDWLNVFLPARPNGSTGWIKRADVDLSTHDFRIMVELGEHRLSVYEKNDMVMQEPVGVGRSATPTTTGWFFTAERIKVLPIDQPIYGPWAFGLSAYSEVLQTFGDGDGQMGIHGTGDPAGVGHDVSNGCIRMTNDAITRLQELVPEAGVPVEILA